MSSRPASATEILSERDLLPRGRLARLGARVILLAEVDSTNSWLLRRANELPDGTIAWAEFQTAGRGRFNRRWLAPRASSVLLSVLLHEPEPTRWSACASQVAALAACEAIEKTTRCTPTLRWPNDIVVNRRKLGGVLAESRPLTAPGAAARRAIVIGIGLNCHQQQEQLEPDLREKATSLRIESGRAVDRGALAAAVVSRLDAYCAQEVARSDALTAITRAWSARCLETGSPARLVHDGVEYAGIIIRVRDDGDLVVQLADGSERSFGAATTTRLW